MPTPPVPPRLRGPRTRRGALADGMSDWQLRHPGIVRTSRDTYLPRASAEELPSRVAAVLLGAPPDAVVSHLSAAALWELEVPLTPRDDRVHLTVAPGVRVRHRADRRIHSSTLTARSVTVLRGVRITSPGRTWLDLAGLVPPAALLAVADQMLARNFPPAAFARVLDEARARRGIRTARRVLPCADPLAGSPMESVVRWLVHEAGLPRPVLQYVVRDEARRFLGRVDMAWPQRRVLVEFDGNVHRDRRVFVDDVRRQNGLVLAGWTVLRFTSADVLGRPERVVAAIGAALGGR